MSKYRKVIKFGEINCTIDPVGNVLVQMDGAEILIDFDTVYELAYQAELHKEKWRNIKSSKEGME